MHSSKIITVLEQFNSIELNRIRKFITSPYFNRSDAIVMLFDLLTGRIKPEGPLNLSKEKLWTIIYGDDTAFNDTRYRKLCSDLLKLVEEYLTIEELNENPLHQANYLLGAVGRRKLDKLNNSSMKSAKSLAKEQKYKTAGHYYHQYLIEDNYYNLSDLETQRNVKSNVEDIINNLDYFYLAEKMRLYCIVLSRQNIVSHEYEVLFMDEIIEHIQKYANEYKDIPPISIYYKVFLTQKEPETQENYHDLIELLQLHDGHLPPSELHVLYSLALNYCIYHINRGRANFVEEYFKLAKLLVETGYLFNPHNGELSPWHFKNIVLIANRLKEYAWSEEFILKFQNNLPVASRDNAVTYNLALVYFYQKQYNKVLEQLQNVQYEDLMYALDSKNLQIAVYYETQEFEPLMSLLDSFSTFLNRHKEIDTSRRMRYQQLIRFVRKLIHLRPGDQKGLAAIKADLIKVKDVASYNWLMQRIDELVK